MWHIVQSLMLAPFVNKEKVELEKSVHSTMMDNQALYEAACDEERVGAGSRGYAQGVRGFRPLLTEETRPEIYQRDLVRGASVEMPAGA